MVRSLFYLVSYHLPNDLVLIVEQFLSRSGNDEMKGTEARREHIFPNKFVMDCTGCVVDGL